MREIIWAAAAARVSAAVVLYFVFRFFWGLFPCCRKGTWKSRLLSAGCGICSGWFIWPLYGTGAMILMHFTEGCLLTLLLDLFLRKKGSGRGRLWNVLARCWAPALALMAAAFVYGYWNMHHVVKTEYDITAEKELDGEGFRAAVISDLHLGLSMDAEGLEKICGRIREEAPDILLLAGDIFDESTRKEEMEKAAAILGGVGCRYGTVFVFGNHDPNLYTEKPAYTKAELKETLERNGIVVLEDESMELGEHIVLTGRKDAGEGCRKGIAELAEEADPEKLWILADHQPVGLKDNAEAGVDLQISGHTHGGQMWPSGPVMEWLGINEMNYGIRKTGNMRIIVSSGLAGWGYPLKTGAPSEYVIIDILPG